MRTSLSFPLPARLGVLALAGLVVAPALAACEASSADAATATSTIFAGRTPAVASVDDRNAVELGVKFRSAKAGNVTGVRFYKGAQNTGTHTGSLWSRSGTLLARATFTNETSTGWQSVTFDKPISIVPNTTYVASYFTSVGRYAANSNFFATATTNGPLTALRNGQDGGNSVYAYGSRSAFPTSSYQGANYWVDVNFTETTTAPAPAPTTTAPAPTTTKAPTTTAPAPTTTKPPTTTTPPATTGFPTPATTGWARTGVTLRPYTGPSIITTPGTVLDGVDSTTCLTIRAQNVTIKRSRIRCAGSYGIMQSSGAQGFMVQDVEITSGSSGLVDRAIAFTDGATMSRVYIHGTQRGIAPGHNTVIEDSYMGDNVNATDAHTSAIGGNGGLKHVVIRRNTLQTAPGTNASSAMSFYPELWAGGANDDFLIDGNLFNSGGGYTVYLGHSPAAGESPNTNFRFVNNKFGTLYYANSGQYGPVASWSNVASNTWANNTWYDQGNGGATKHGQLVNP